MAAWVTGTSVISCVGGDVDALWRAAEEGLSGLHGGLGPIPEVALMKARAEFRNNPTFCDVSLPASRSKELTLLGLEQAMRSAGWDQLGPDDGLILATTSGQIPMWDKALTEFLRGAIPREDFVTAFEHQPLGDLFQTLGFKGRQLLISSACSASTQALGVAAMWLEQGLVKRCVVGGVEVLCELTVRGFSSLSLLSEEACKPFDAHRAGINLSEASAFLCLEKEKSSRALACVSGFGLSSDGHHMTAPHPEGKGCYMAMKAALASAGISPGEVDWIHAHGTGSVHNDQAEAAAINMLFGESGPWVSSSKWIHGHALGASGAVETILCIEALRRQMILQTYGMTTPDEHLRVKHPAANTRANVRHILKNTLGFGGTNAALVVSREDA